MYVKDATGTHRDEYLFTTDPAMTADPVVGTDFGRWNIETTFQECRSCTRLETTQDRSRKPVCWAAPCLSVLDSVVAVLYHLLPEAKRTGSGSWPGKEAVTFSDAVTGVRRWIWAEGVFPQAGADGAIAELPTNGRDLLLSGLAPAP